jgi:hypothetical protein
MSKPCVSLITVWMPGAFLPVLSQHEIIRAHVDVVDSHRDLGIPPKLRFPQAHFENSTNSSIKPGGRELSREIQSQLTVFDSGALCSESGIRRVTNLLQHQPSALVTHVLICGHHVRPCSL